MKKIESPKAYFNRVMAKEGLTHDKVAKRAQSLGFKLSKGYVHNIARGTANNPSISLVKALAAGIGKPEDEVFDVFRGRQLKDETAYQESIFAVLWNEYRKLSPSDQKELRIAIDMALLAVSQRLKDKNKVSRRPQLNEENS